MNTPVLTAFAVLFALVAVGAMVVVGEDILAAKRRGPRWRRRVVGLLVFVASLQGARAVFERWLRQQREIPRPPAVSCYLMEVLPPRAPTQHLVPRRLLMLERLARDGRIDPVVVEKTLGTMASELDTADKRSR
jgi:hypothetical protein